MTEFFSLENLLALATMWAVLALIVYGIHRELSQGKRPERHNNSHN